MEANDTQVGGTHYTSPYQHWDFVEDALFGLYLEGQITKYVYRWRKKNGVQDLQKAKHFAQKLSEMRFGEHASPAHLNAEHGINPTEYTNRFITENQVPELETTIIRRVVTWKAKRDLLFVMDCIDQLIADA